MDVMNAVDFPVHRTPAVRAVERASTYILRHVEFGAFEVVAHEVHHVEYADFLVGQHPQRHAVGREVIGGLTHIGGVRLGALDVATRGIAPIVLHVVGHLVEHSPHAQVAEAGAIEGDGVVDIGERELLIGAVIKLHVLGKLDDVVGIDAVDLGVFQELVDVLEGDASLAFSGSQREGGNAGLVGVTADIAVGDATGHPHGAFVSLALANHLEDPHLFGVADAERLALADVAVVGHQLAHALDGFAGGLGALQGDVNQAAVVDDALAFPEAFEAAVGRLADSQLVFVHVADHVIGMCHFGDLAAIHATVPVVDVAHGACRPVGGGIMIKFAIEHMAVGGIADHAGSIGRSAFGNQEVSAGIGLPEGKNEDQSQDCSEYFFHWI